MFSLTFRFHSTISVFVRVRWRGRDGSEDGNVILEGFFDPSVSPITSSMIHNVALFDDRLKRCRKEGSRTLF